MAAKFAPKFVNGLGELCNRCNVSTAVLQIRADQVCEKCFLQYINTKVVKRMELYRARRSMVTAPKKLLMPISFGSSSMSLLHILDCQMQAQLDRMRRTSYELLLVHVDLELDNMASSKNPSSLPEKIKSRFSRHRYIAVGLEDALDIPDMNWEALGLTFVEDESSSVSRKEKLKGLLRAIDSHTSKVDIVLTLLTRLLVNIAKEHKCETILFGDSTTRLAEKTLTETAKGRGFSLPWQVSDGMSPYGINFCYPQRDLLKKELVTFSSTITPSLMELIIPESSSQVSASSKSTTIDDLMAHYFETVERDYPSIVANVVRTSSKLKAPDSAHGTIACGVCGLPVVEGTDGIYGWGGDQSSDRQSSRVLRPDHGVLCYGCSRSIYG